MTKVQFLHSSRSTLRHGAAFFPFEVVYPSFSAPFLKFQICITVAHELVVQEPTLLI